MSWTVFERTGFALYDFDAADDSQVSLRVQNRVEIQEEAGGWYKGNVYHDNMITAGMFPASYVQLDPVVEAPPAPPPPMPVVSEAAQPVAAEPVRVARVDLSAMKVEEMDVIEDAPAVRPTSLSVAVPHVVKSVQAEPVPQEQMLQRQKTAAVGDASTMSIDTLKTEISRIHREWSVGMQTSLANGATKEYYRIRQRMSILLDLRRQIYRTDLSETALDALRREVIQLLESSRRTEEGYMVPRTSDGEFVDPSNTNLVGMHTAHKDMWSTMKEETTTLWAKKTQDRQQDAMVAAQSYRDKNSAGDKAKTSGFEIGSTLADDKSAQIMLDIKACIFSVGESTELQFHLYNGKEKRVVSEVFHLELTASGMPADLNAWTKMNCIFKDIKRSDLLASLYLVCHIYRCGKLVYDEKVSTSSSALSAAKGTKEKTYRRPFGCAVMLLSGTEMEKHLNKEWLPASNDMPIFTVLDENRFHHIAEMIISKQDGIEPAPRAKGIVVSICMYEGDLQHVTANYPRTKDVAIARKLSSDVVEVDERRNEFYLKLCAGDFLQDGKTSAKNIEVGVRVMTSSGQIVENCITRGIGYSCAPMSEYRSAVLYHNNSPNFIETVRLVIPHDMFERCHVFFTFWHVSTSSDKSKAFAFGCLPLTNEQGVCIPDTESLTIGTFAPFDKMEQPAHGKTFYLNPRDSKLEPRKETFTVGAKLCSTQRTQNADLHALFAWKSQPDHNALKMILKKYTLIPGSELVRFLRETFDCLMAILDAQLDSLEVNQAAFNALLYTLDQLTSKFTTFGPVVDAYIKDVFRASRVHHVLMFLTLERLQSAKTISSTTPQPETLKSLMLICKCLKHVLRFIVKSRHVDSVQAKPSCTEAYFKDKVLELFRLLNELMQHGAFETQDVLVGCKAFVIKHFASYFEDLVGILTAHELGMIPRGFLESISTIRSRMLNLDKLKLIKNLLDGEVGRQLQARLIVVPVIVQLLCEHLCPSLNNERSTAQASRVRSASVLVQSAADVSGRGAFANRDPLDLDEPHVCVAILRALLTVIQQYSDNSAEHIHSQAQQLLTTLPDLLRLAEVAQLMHSGEIAVKAVSAAVQSFVAVDLLVDVHTLLWSILHLQPDQQFNAFLESLAWLGPESDQGLSALLTRLFHVCIGSLKMPLYPDMWVQMIYLQFNVLVKLCHLIPNAMKVHMLEGTQFVESVWIAYFTMSFAMLHHEHMVLEAFQSTKRTFIVDRHGDLRDKLIPHVQSMWQYMGADKQLKLTSLIVPKTLFLIRTTQGSTWQLAFDMYTDVLRVEFQLTDSFKSLERHTIDALYVLANISQDDCLKFLATLTQSVTDKLKHFAATDAALQALSEAGLTLFGEIKHLCQLMCSLLRFPDTAMYEDERTAVALHLMEYLESQGGHKTRREMYCRYVQTLVDLHRGLKNHVEAATTTLQHIAMYDWSSTQTVDALGDFPAESEKTRKERLYHAALKMYDDGEAWERGVALAEELRAYYQSTYQYDRLSDLLKQQAQFFSKILHNERFYANYYRVVYYGVGFDADILGKEFIYRGERMEPVMDFTNRLKKKFPGAKIFMSSDAPPAEMMAANSQIISITTLTCSSREEMEGHEAPWVKNEGKIPSQITRAAQAFDLSVFQYSKGVQRSADPKPQNEFKDLWVQKVFLVSSHAFPANRRRCLVVSRSELMLPPIVNAVMSLVAKNKELKEKIDKTKQATNGAVAEIGSLSMALNGTIDAAVNGGTQKYIEAFLTPEFSQNAMQSNDQVALDHVQKMKVELRTQLSELRRGLEVFGARCDDQLKGLHAHLTTFLTATQEKMKAVLA